MDRKLVKQTVMTSVYGVTHVGARQQIQRRLRERGLIDDDRVLYKASSYASKVLSREMLQKLKIYLLKLHC